jgi:hypothetical protein
VTTAENKQQGGDCNDDLPRTIDMTPANNRGRRNWDESDNEGAEEVIRDERIATAGAQKTT